MSNSYRPPNSGIKPYNQTASNRQMYATKKDAAATPLTIPKSEPTKLQTSPNNFEKLRNMLMSKK